MKHYMRKIRLGPWVQRKLSFPIMISLLTFVVCCSSEDEYPQYNPPLDHTINKDGVMHKSGISDPTLNCVDCHGNDLEGGTSQVSCYECHGREW